jgi:hypothetical protein
MLQAPGFAEADEYQARQSTGNFYVNKINAGIRWCPSEIQSSNALGPHYLR